MTQPNPELEIKSDADWKQRVKDEAAQLDASLRSESMATADQPAQTSAPEETGDTAPDAAARQPFDTAKLPPADFTMLVTMFSTQAMVSLGVVPSPDTGKPEPNLPLAKHFIDLLGVLQEKTKRNLTGHEANLLEGSLHELRLAYVELSKPAAESSPPT